MSPVVGLHGSAIERTSHPIEVIVADGNHADHLCEPAG